MQPRRFIVAFAAVLCCLGFGASQARAQYTAQIRPELELIPGFTQSSMPFRLRDIAPPTQRDGFGLTGPVRLVKMRYAMHEGEPQPNMIVLFDTTFTESGEIARLEGREVLPPFPGEEPTPERDAPSVTMVYVPAETDQAGETRWTITIEGLPADVPAPPPGELVRRADEKGRPVYRRNAVPGWFVTATEVEYREDGTAQARVTVDGEQDTFTFDAQRRLASATNFGDQIAIAWEGDTASFDLGPGDRDPLTITLDDHGTPVRGNVPEFGGPEGTEWRNTITYDDRGNWTEIRTEMFDPDHKTWGLHRVMTREITYW